MSLLAKLNKIMEGLSVPVETGVFSGVPPEEYAVLTPLTDTFSLFADNNPLVDVAEVRISFYTCGNYLMRTALIAEALFTADITVTARTYMGFEPDSKYHHYSVDCADFECCGAAEGEAADVAAEEAKATKTKKGKGVKQ